MKKTNNIKIYIQFGLIMFACFFIGILAGAVSRWLQKDIAGWNTVAVMNALQEVISVAFPILVVVMFAVALAFYLQAKKQAKLWDGEDEVTISKIERKLCMSLILEGIAFMVSFVLYPLGIWAYEIADTENFVTQLSYPISFLGNLVAYFLLVKIVVGLEKKLNPEKQGNVFEIHFQRKWEESMDEAEQLQLGKAAKKAFGAGQMACSVLWVISFMSMFLFHTGILPIICVTVIWLIMFLTYSVEEMKR